MQRRTLLSDPIYGLIEVRSRFLFGLLGHAYVQRLRRIAQLAFSQYVYPAATHSRFSHALGALHLMQTALGNLRSQGLVLSRDEEQAACAAILLHDIGHAPFSHSLEFALMDVPHEQLSLLMMQAMRNQGVGGDLLDLSIRIFKDEYPRRFLHQLVSGQLDMDRLDYLTRDSFFTGVSDGVVAYDRILKMLLVQDDELVLDRKGIYSVENFLTARRAMYWQVYLHKTVVGAGELLSAALRRARYLLGQGERLLLSDALLFFLSEPTGIQDLQSRPEQILEHYTALDDTDIWMALKRFERHSDFVLRFLAERILNRRLFKIEYHDAPLSPEAYEALRRRIEARWNISPEESAYLIFQGVAGNRAYAAGSAEIQVRSKDGSLMPLSQWQESPPPANEVIKYFRGYPKELSESV